MSTPPRRYEDDLPRYLALGVLIGFVALLLTAIAYAIGTHNNASITTTQPAASATGGATSSTGGTSSTTAGRQLFIQSGCGGCHTFASAGTNATIGPNLDNVAEAAEADKNMSLTSYIRVSITDPAAYIAPGFQKGVMPTYYATKLSRAQLSQLVTFIAAGQNA